MDQVGPSGTGYAQAKATYDQNQALQKQMLGDDKFRKVLEKGMNISLTDPSKNKTPDHQSFMQGMLHFKKQQQAQQPQDPSAMLQRFGQQMPTQLAPNQQAIQQLQMKQQLDAANAAMAKDKLGYAKSMLETEGKLDVAKIRTYGEWQVAQFNATKAFALQEAGFAHSEKMENLRKSNDLLVDAIKRDREDHDPIKLSELFTTFAKDYSAQTVDIEKQRADITDKIAKENAKTFGKDPGLIQELRRQEAQLQEVDHATHAVWDANRTFMEKNLNITMPELDPSKVEGTPGAPGAPGEEAPRSAIEQQWGITKSGNDPLTGQPWDKSVTEGQRFWLDIIDKLSKFGAPPG
jgi:hypothetical protein